MLKRPKKAFRLPELAASANREGGRFSGGFTSPMCAMTAGLEAGWQDQWRSRMSARVFEAVRGFKGLAVQLTDRGSTRACGPGKEQQIICGVGPAGVSGAVGELNAG